MTAAPYPLVPPGLNPDATGPWPRSSLVALWGAVANYFEAVESRAKVFLGIKNRDLWDTSRVVIIDGEFDGTAAPKPRNAGSFVAPWQVASVNPRELVGWKRPVTLSIRAYDPANIDKEAAQVAATEALIEMTVRAVHNAVVYDVQGNPIGIGQANIDWSEGKALWVDPGSSTQQTWGKEFLVGFTYKTPLFDGPEQIVFPTPALAKGTLLNSLTSGSNASIATAFSDARTAVVSGMGFCSPAQVGMSLALSGAASGSNNGTFPIVAYLTPSSLVVGNGAAVAPDANNGAIAWAIVPTP